jgi:hypothetical protein
MRVILPLLLLGCTGESDKLDSHRVALKLVNPTTAKPFVGVTQLQLTLTDNGAEVFQQTLSMDGPLQVPNLDEYGVIRFELAGLNDDNEVLSFGRSAEIAVVPNVEREVAITFLPVNEVLTLSADTLDARSFHTTTKTPDGRVLLLGGLNAAGSDSLSSIEYYEPESGRFVPFATFLSYDALLPRVSWNEDQVLVVSGGEQVSSGSGTRRRDTNLINPAYDSVETVEPMGFSRKDHCFKTVSGQLIIAVGGTSTTSLGVELFRPAPENPGVWQWDSGVLETFQPYNVQGCVQTPDKRIFFQGTGDLSTGTYTYTAEIGSFMTGFSIIDFTQSNGAYLVYPYGQSMVPLSASRVWLGGGRLNLDGDGDLTNDPSPGLTREFDMDARVFVQGADPNLSERTWGSVKAWLEPGVHAFACGGTTGNVIDNPHLLVEIADLESELVLLATTLDRPRPGCAMDVLDDGSLLITGGHIPGEPVQDGGAILVPYLD